MLRIAEYYWDSSIIAWKLMRKDKRIGQKVRRAPGGPHMMEAHIHVCMSFEDVPESSLVGRKGMQ